MMRIGLLVLVCSLVGCGEKFYTQRVFNESGQKIDDVVIHFGKLQSSFGVLSPNAQAVKMSMKTPPPKIATVTLIDEQKKPYSIDVDLTVVPKNYNNGVITFTIQKDFSVNVGFYTDKPVKIPATR